MSEPKEHIAAIIDKVTQHAEPLCMSMELELVHVEFVREAAGRVMRLYIDKAGGVNLSDCAALSTRLGDILDVEFGDDELGPYNLEVTSPGIERPLSKLADYERFKGKTAKVRVAKVINGQKNFRGKLRGVKGNAILIDNNDETIEIPYAAISKARLAEN